MQDLVISLHWLETFPFPNQDSQGQSSTEELAVIKPRVLGFGGKNVILVYVSLLTLILLNTGSPQIRGYHSKRENISTVLVALSVGSILKYLWYSEATFKLSHGSLIRIG